MPGAQTHSSCTIPRMFSHGRPALSHEKLEWPSLVGLFLARSLNPFSLDRLDVTRTTGKHRKCSAFLLEYLTRRPAAGAVSSLLPDAGPPWQRYAYVPDDDGALKYLDPRCYVSPPLCDLHLGTQERHEDLQSPRFTPVLPFVTALRGQFVQRN
ncbi:hypothetical protein KM043_008308 [Ampulex compressa]|nr:hypothetical protein KM043_008308 [Ampulex compressa]